MSTYMLPVFALMAVACAAGTAFVVASVHRYPNWTGDDDPPDVPEDAPVRQQMR